MKRAPSQTRIAISSKISARNIRSAFIRPPGKSPGGTRCASTSPVTALCGWCTEHHTMHRLACIECAPTSRLGFSLSRFHSVPVNVIESNRMIRRKKFVLRLPSRTLLLGEHTLIMGVLNLTPDSFSDGGRFVDPRKAVAHALEMERAGADIIDIGAESTRPGSRAIPAQ